MFFTIYLTIYFFMKYNYLPIKYICFNGSNIKNIISETSKQLYKVIKVS